MTVFASRDTTDDGNNNNAASRGPHQLAASWCKYHCHCKLLVVVKLLLVFVAAVSVMQDGPDLLLLSWLEM